jgi:hypothetical protein
MELHQIPNKSYVRIIPQIEPSPYSGLKSGDQIDLEQSIAQVEWENGNNLESKVHVPPGARDIKKGELIFFDHIDGMYSFCYQVDPDTLEHSHIVHIAAWTQVEPVELGELFTFEEIRTKIGRSGYGKTGKGKHRSAQLFEMNDEWVTASIPYVPEDHPHRKYYIKELEYRKEHGIAIDDTED